MTFAIESQIDQLAEEAGIDPMEFRLLNPFLHRQDGKGEKRQDNREQALAMVVRSGRPWLRGGTKK